MREDKRILFVTDSAFLTTGYANVVKNLCNTLELKYPIFYYAQHGLFYNKPVLWNNGVYFKYYNIDTDEGDSRGYRSFPRVIHDYKPDIVVTINDPWATTFIEERFNMFKDTFKWVNYLAIDSEPLVKTIRTPHYDENHGPIYQRNDFSIIGPDQLIVFTEFGKKAILEAGLKPKNEIKVIPHGVDTEFFYPISKGEAANVIQKIFNIKSHDLTNSFVFGFVGVNQIRKGIPLLIEAFSKFYRDWKHKKHVHKEPLLLLYVSHSNFAWTLEELVNEFKDVASRIIILETGMVGYAADDYILRYLYNVFDAFVMPSNREGWCLPVLEALATGCPVIVTKYGPMWEWSKPVAVPIEVKMFTRTFLTNYKEAHIDVNDLRKKMWKVYSKDLKQMNKEAYRKFAERFDWNIVAEQWIEVFNEIDSPSRKLERIEITL